MTIGGRSIKVIGLVELDILDLVPEDALVDPRSHILLCPVVECRGEYSHIAEVYTRMGSDPHEACVYETTCVKEHSGERRSGLVIRIDGECGHRWNLVIQQHKGNNFVTTEILDDVPEEALVVAPIIG